MKTLSLLTLAVAFAVAADISVQYAGTTAGAATWNYPSLSSGSPCAAGTTTSPYVSFNATFPYAGVRGVSAMAEGSFKSSLLVFVYQGGFPTSTCAGLAHTVDLDKQIDGSGGPPINDFVYFEAGLYTFVVTGGSTGGIFAVHVDPSDAVGTTSASSPTWDYPSVDSTNECTQQTGSNEQGFGMYQWTQATTGFYDLYVFFANQTLTDAETYVVLYQGSPTAAQISEGACNASLFLNASDNDYLGLFLPYIKLTTGVNYTLAFSLGEGEFGYWGVRVIPTLIRYFDGISGFEQPRGSSAGECEANSGYASTPYGVTFFGATERVYILDTAEPPYPFESIDTYSFLYDGANTAIPPTTCPLFAPLVLAGDTGDITPIYTFTNIGSNYTAVVSSYSSSPSVDATTVYVLYFYTGLPIGSIPSGTTGATTVTGTVGTGSTATGTGSTATGTGSTAASTVTGTIASVTTTATQTGRSTNSATEAFVSLAVIAVAALSAVL